MAAQSTRLETDIVGYNEDGIDFIQYIDIKMKYRVFWIFMFNFQSQKN